MRHLGRIRGLGNIYSNPFPVVETVGGVAGTGLIVGGIVTKGTAGTVMGVLGGVALLGSAVALILKLASGAAAPQQYPQTLQPAPLPPPPPAPRAPSYAKYAEYAQAALPVVNSLFTKLFGVNTQPRMMVVGSRR
jgi:hypothetical protein